LNFSADDWNRLPTAWRQVVESQLEPQESVAAFFRVDLDDSLGFSDGLALLTAKRLLIVPPRQASPAPQTGQEQSSSARFEHSAIASWPLSAISSLTTHDRGGLGQFEVVGHAARLANLHYTLGQAGAVRELVETFENLQLGKPLPLSNAGSDPDAAPEAEEQAPPASVAALFRLFRFARRRVWGIVLGALLTLGTTAAGLVAPGLTEPLIDDILDPYSSQAVEVKTKWKKGEIDAAQRDEELATLKEGAQSPFRDVPFYLGLMVVSAVLAWLLGWAQGLVLARLSERVSADTRNATYEHLQKLSLDFFSAKRTGDLVARISSDTDRICNFLSDSLMDFVTDALMIIGTVAVLFYKDRYLAFATLLTFPIIGWLTYRLRESLQHGFLSGGRAWGEMTSILSDTIPGIRVVKAFAQERRETERFRDANDRIIAANDRVNAVWTFFWPVVTLLNQAGLLIAWGVGAWRIYDQRITVGLLMACLAYIARFYTRLESMSRIATNTQRAAASAQRIFEILDRVPSVPEPAHPVSPGKIRGEIEIRDISFRYGNRQVIDGVTLSIRPGEMIGLVGTTGAGKSTLVNLVCRFYDVTNGSILVDGNDVRSFRIAEYRRHIGIVLQDPFLFFGTIAENIAYGRPDSTREEIIAAARAARAHEFILQLPDGYDSIVGERGQTLSGGERQRISIARALLIDPRILILDEATSSVDTQTERQIQEALDNLVRGRTTIAIAHRLSTLRKADRLVVLERGQIVEIGNHQELLARPGTYARLYHAQMQLAHDFGEPPAEPESGNSSINFPDPNEPPHGKSLEDPGPDE